LVVVAVSYVCGMSSGSPSGSRRGSIGGSASSNKKAAKPASTTGKKQTTAQAHQKPVLQRTGRASRNLNVLPDDKLVASKSTKAEKSSTVKKQKAPKLQPNEVSKHVPALQKSKRGSRNLPTSQTESNTNTQQEEVETRPSTAARPKLTRGDGQHNIYSIKQPEQKGLAGRVYNYIPAANILPLHIVALLLSQNAYKADNVEQIYDGDFKKDFLKSLSKPWETVLVAGEPSSELVSKIFVNKVAKVAVISQRGTKNTENIKADINFFKTPCKLQNAVYGKVHTGFYNTYLLNQEQIVNGIDQYVQEGYRIVFTGHSMGAALAMLTALDVATKYQNDDFVKKNNPIIITFAGPKLGNSEFNAAVNSFYPQDKIVRYVTRWNSLGTSTYDRVSTVGCQGCEHPKSNKLILKCEAASPLACHKMESYFAGVKAASVLLQ